MAGRRKKRENLTLEEQFEMITKEIEDCEEQLKKLKQKKKELDIQMKEEKKEALYQAVVDSGKTIDEILAAISEKKENE